jgi:hypothetical protein
MSGAEQFTQWIKLRKFKSKTAAAAFLGMNKSIVTKLANGRRCPGRTNALRLQDLTGIPVSAWGSETADKSKSRRRAKRRNLKADKVSTSHAAT